MILQYMWAGFSNGCLISLMALGFCLVYRTFSIFNLAYACVFIAAGYVGYLFSCVLGWQLLPSAVLGILVATVLGWAIDLAVYRPLSRKKAGWNVLFVASIGVYIFFANAFAVVFGSSSKAIIQGGTPVWRLGSLSGSYVQLAQVASMLGALVAVFLVLTRTHSGRTIRALGDNAMLAAVLGCNTNRVRTLVFFLSSLFAAVAGILSAIDIGVTPHSGMGLVLNAAVATMIAGRKNLYVAAFAGIMLGMVQSFTVMFWSAQWQQLSTFTILIAVLMIRRQGLFSFEMRAEEL